MNAAPTTALPNLLDFNFNFTIPQGEPTVTGFRPPLHFRPNVTQLALPQLQLQQHNQRIADLTINRRAPLSAITAHLLVRLILGSPKKKMTATELAVAFIGAARDPDWYATVRARVILTLKKNDDIFIMVVKKAVGHRQGSLWRLRALEDNFAQGVSIEDAVDQGLVPPDFASKMNKFDTVHGPVRAFITEHPLTFNSYLNRYEFVSKTQTLKREILTRGKAGTCSRCQEVAICEKCKGKMESTMARDSVPCEKLQQQPSMMASSSRQLFPLPLNRYSIEIIDQGVIAPTAPATAPVLPFSVLSLLPASAPKDQGLLISKYN